MEWRIKYHRDAKKFLEKLDKNRRRLILDRLEELKRYLQDGIIPIRRLDIKKLRGKWEGFLRIRVGEFRIIVKIDPSTRIIYVYHVHLRGEVYK